jgi:hypothetical protein
VSELDEAWAVALAEAEEKARAAGRKDISEYLALRGANDLIRKIGSDWLLTMFEKVAAEANRANAGIHIARDDEHRFKVGTASMVGRRLSFGRGVRVLLVETGWPRTPRDGFIRGGGLACANIKHLGIKSKSEELRLVLNPGGTPVWIARGGKRGARSEIHEADLRNHIATLLDDSQVQSRRS